MVACAENVAFSWRFPANSQHFPEESTKGSLLKEGSCLRLAKCRASPGCSLAWRLRALMRSRLRDRAGRCKSAADLVLRYDPFRPALRRPTSPLKRGGFGALQNWKCSKDWVSLICDFRCLVRSIRGQSPDRQADQGTVPAIDFRQPLAVLLPKGLNISKNPHGYL